ncbi:MAG: YtxH domain-containing protein [Gemmatimonadetes bacterium]|nr:YtxH domain-containing protein [Gemmatimonadota bacterium]
MSEDPGPYVIVEKRGSGFAAFIWGAIVGAGVALLLAPKTGEETQRELREGARKLRDEAGERLTDLKGSIEDGYGRARGEVGDRVDAARQSVRDRQAKAGEALKAGKDAARRARSDLESRIAESKAAYKATLSESETAEPSENGEAES